ncbi:right-handed parallel beta-helix repeat-containing protein [Streptomyces sp. WMMC500]|uniref:right-handed parallel beta-helix repeat-containing protein n=1 Tax=Streptomyces sp. WMMC500 TaxID=3015154 RepID=UPI00248D3279|nr:right-handed parallel beta-helix repeat-containing protein [Streptomyces sp. WMMC500]WBB59584.1 right-handed parallel beta-helix repeat-containing protein [Streptomyces sp. WMMC500]
MRTGTRRSAALLCLLVFGCELPEPYVPPGKNSGGGYTYYVSPDGDDDHDGLSPARAWRTLEHADGARLRPGDRLRLRAGARFRGELTLDERDAGSAEEPVKIESYGKGRATIAASGGTGISVHNTAGVEIRDLNLVGDRASFRKRPGINFFADAPDGGKLENVAVSGVDVSHFRTGIGIGAGKGTSGFRDVRISNSTVRDNKDAGLSAYGPDFDAGDPAYAHERVTVFRVRAYGNDGDPAAHGRNTGSGIILGSIRGGKVQRAVAHDNGSKSSAEALEGPEGIWTYDSTRMVIENSVAYANHTGSRSDGGGFGLDNNVSSSVLQYNLSYGNDGPGYLVYSAADNRAQKDNTVRFNLSGGDSGKLSMYGGIVAYGKRVQDVDIYHNTVVQTGGGAVRAPALRLQEGLTGARVYNNIFVTDGAPLVDSSTPYPPAKVRFRGNTYFSTGQWALRWGAGTYDALSGWRGGTGQEVLDSAPTGTTGDPCLPGAAAPITSVAGAARMVPACADGVAGAVDLESLGVDPGPVDYFGERLSESVSSGAAQPEPEP